MRDLSAVIWTRVSGAPAKLADVVFTDEEVRVSYDQVAVREGLPGVSALLPPSEYADAPYVFRRTEALSVPPFIWSKIPLDNGDNVHRRILAGIVGRYDPPPPPGFQTDYEILLLAGRDGIGHLDFFRDDGEARRHYGDTRRRATAPTVLDGRSGLWQAVGNALGEDLGGPGADRLTVDQILQSVGPTPSAGGMIPKFLFAIPDGRDWDGRVAATGTRKAEGTPFVDVLVKIETTKYPGLVALEDLCYDVHEGLGCDLPRRWRLTTGEGLRLLAVERFDRRRGVPLPTESFFSLMNIATRPGTVLSPTAGSYEQVAALLRLRDPAVTEVAGDAREFVKRFCIALLTGNGDLHLENVAVLTRAGRRRLSPVFDPAPMRAYPQHDMVSALPWMRGMQHDRFGLPGDLAQRLERLSGAFGIDEGAFHDLLTECLAGTEDYLDQVAGLATVPQAQAASLRNAVEAVRYRLARHVGYEGRPAEVVSGPRAW